MFCRLFSPSRPPPKAEQTGWIDVEGLEDYLNGLGYPGADILPWFLPEGDEWVLDESYGSFDLYIADADTTTTFDSVIAELEKGDWTVTAKGDVDTGYGFSITVCNYGICRCLRNDLQPADSGLRHLGHGNVLHLLRSPPVGPKEDNALMTWLADNFSTSVNCTIDYSLAYWHAPVDQSTVNLSPIPWSENSWSKEPLHHRRSLLRPPIWKIRFSSRTIPRQAARPTKPEKKRNPSTATT